MKQVSPDLLAAALIEAESNDQLGPDYSPERAAAAIYAALPDQPDALRPDLERPETLALLFIIASCVVPLAEQASPDGGRRRAQLARAAEGIDKALATSAAAGEGGEDG